MLEIVYGGPDPTVRDFFRELFKKLNIDNDYRSAYPLLLRRSRPAIDDLWRTICDP